MMSPNLLLFSAKLCFGKRGCHRVPDLKNNEAAEQKPRRFGPEIPAQTAV